MLLCVRGDGEREALLTMQVDHLLFEDLPEVPFLAALSMVHDHRESEESGDGETLSRQDREAMSD